MSWASQWEGGDRRQWGWKRKCSFCHHLDSRALAEEQEVTVWEFGVPPHLARQVTAWISLGMGCLWLPKVCYCNSPLQTDWKSKGEEMGVKLNCSLLLATTLTRPRVVCGLMRLCVIFPMAHMQGTERLAFCPSKMCPLHSYHGSRGVVLETKYGVVWNLNLLV